MEEGQAGGAWGQNTSISILAWPASDSFILLQVHLLMSSSALPDHQEVNSLCDTGLSPWCSASPQVEMKPVDWSLLCCGLRLLRSQREQIFHPQNWREGKAFIPALLSRLKLQAYSLLCKVFTVKMEGSNMRRCRKNTATLEKGDHIHMPYIRDAADVNLSLRVENRNPSG